MELSTLPKLSLGYTLSPIMDSRLRRYIELQVLKLVSMEIHDMKAVKNLNRIRVQSPIYERLTEYSNLYNKYLASRSTDDAQSLITLSKELGELAGTVADIIQDVSMKEEDFLETTKQAKTDAAEKLRSEFKFLKTVLGNLFKFTLPEEKRK